MGTQSSKIEENKDKIHEGDFKHKLESNKNKEITPNSLCQQHEVKLPVVEHEHQYLDSGPECSICLEEYGPDVQKKQILCGHCFCVTCITKALELFPYCPLCRKHIVNVDLPSIEEIASNQDSQNNSNHNLEGNNNNQNKQLSFDDWNIDVIRSHFSRDSFFDRNGRNFFDRDVFNNNPFFQNARKRMEEDSSKFNQNNQNVFNGDPFLNKDHSQVFKNDPFFNKDNSEVFKNDPFFNKDHSQVFKNDPFFNNSTTHFGNNNGFAGFNYR